MRYMNWSLFFACAFLKTLGTCLVFTAASTVGNTVLGESELVLVRDGQTDYTIIVWSDAHSAELNAAKILQSHLQEMSGASFPIRSEAAAGQRIILQISQAAGDVLDGVPNRKLATEELLLESVGDTLVLTGGGPRGVIYAVYKFLELKLGCRWYSLGYGKNPDVLP